MLQIKLVSDRAEMFGKVKSVADQIIQFQLDTGKCLVLSTQISNELNVDYNAFSNLLLSKYGVTPERIFVIRLIEKVKELLVYTEQSFKEIASALGYK